MVVDDSAVVRGMVTRWFGEEGQSFDVISCGDGAQALRRVLAQPCDVIVLDVEMPGMGGLEVLPELLKVRPGVPIIMASTYTRRNAEVSFRALALGAADYVTKPSSLGGRDGVDQFRHELISKVRALADSRRAAVRRNQSQLPQDAVAPPPSCALLPLYLPDKCPHVLAIGCSTGGPQALMTILKGLTALPLPILVAQHMPPVFTSVLSDQITRATGLPCVEGNHGDEVVSGTVYIAPGDRHMEVHRDALGSVRIALTQAPPENHCRPAVDVLFRTVARVYGMGALALVLTGMGVDGREGARAITAAGGTVVVQDEPSSTVWGMPGAIVGAGLSKAIWPLHEIAPRLSALFSGGGHAS